MKYIAVTLLCLWVAWLNNFDMGDASTRKIEESDSRNGDADFANSPAKLQSTDA